jgi:glutathione peroxidase
MTVYDFKAKTIEGKEQSLADYSGKVLLVVNVASQCGLTPHYAGLQGLYENFRDQGSNARGI